LVLGPSSYYAYKINQVFEAVLTNSGADTSFGPSYGELTPGSMDKICDMIDEIFRRLKTTMNGKSFVDLGAGGNRLAGHIAARYPRAKVALGIECMMQRTGLAAKVIITLLEDHSLESKAHAWAPCTVVSANIAKLTSLSGYEVWMSFNSAFPAALMRLLALLWNASDAYILILFTNEADMVKLGFFYWNYEGSLDALMKGSGEGKTCHIYTRDPNQNLPQEVPIVEKKDEEESDTSEEADEDDDIMNECERYYATTTTSSPEERIRQAVDLCKNGPRADFINYLQCTFEDGLRTSRSVVLPNGKEVKQSIRIKNPIIRFGGDEEEPRVVAKKQRR
jgi:hypothetical protein